MSTKRASNYFIYWLHKRNPTGSDPQTQLGVNAMDPNLTPKAQQLKVPWLRLSSPSSFPRELVFMERKQKGAGRSIAETCPSGMRPAAPKSRSPTPILLAPRGRIFEKTTPPTRSPAPQTRALLGTRVFLAREVAQRTFSLLLWCSSEHDYMITRL